MKLLLVLLLLFPSLYSLNLAGEEKFVSASDGSNYNVPKLVMINGRYQNPQEYKEAGDDSSFLNNSFKIFYSTMRDRWGGDYFKNCEDNDHEKIIEKWYHPSKPSESSKEPKITWIGHASFLIQLDNINVLTDPVFENLSNLIYTRTFEKPGVAFTDLPSKIDTVLISHNHFDHMEESTLLKLKKFKPEPRLLVPIGLKKWFVKKGFHNVFEFNWGDQLLGVEDKINFTFLPAKHASNRGLFDLQKSGWGSWMIENKNGKKIFFAGDTGPSPHFEDIAKKAGKIDVAIMPIGPNEPADLMAKVGHIKAEEAGEAFLKLDAKYFVPMHWGTFRLGTDSFIVPLERIKKWWEKNSDRLKDRVLIDDLAIGGTKDF